MSEDVKTSLGSALLVVLMLCLCLAGLYTATVLYDEVIFVQKKAFFAFGFFFCGFVVGWAGEILFGIDRSKD